MPLDAIVLTALRRELTAALTGAKVDRIGMPEKDLLILSLRTRDRGNAKLLISLRPGSARIHLTKQNHENPAQPPMFCMLLRKHLLGARITGLDQPEGERLIIVRFDASDELSYHSERTLVLELMGKGIDLILTDAEGRILDCTRRLDYSENARRALLPGAGIHAGRCEVEAVGRYARDCEGGGRRAPFPVARLHLLPPLSFHDILQVPQARSFLRGA